MIRRHPPHRDAVEVKGRGGQAHARCRYCGLLAMGSRAFCNRVAGRHRIKYRSEGTEALP